MNVSLVDGGNNFIFGNFAISVGVSSLEFFLEICELVLKVTLCIFDVFLEILNLLCSVVFETLSDFFQSDLAIVVLVELAEDLVGLFFWGGAHVVLVWVVVGGGVSVGGVVVAVVCVSGGGIVVTCVTVTFGNVGIALSSGSRIVSSSGIGGSRIISGSRGVFSIMGLLSKENGATAWSMCKSSETAFFFLSKENGTTAWSMCKPSETAFFFLCIISMKFDRNWMIFATFSYCSSHSLFMPHKWIHEGRINSDGFRLGQNGCDCKCEFHLFLILFLIYNYLKFALLIKTLICLNFIQVLCKST